MEAGDGAIYPGECLVQGFLMQPTEHLFPPPPAFLRKGRAEQWPGPNTLNTCASLAFHGLQTGREAEEGSDDSAVCSVLGRARGGRDRKERESGFQEI